MLEINIILHVVNLELKVCNKKGHIARACKFNSSSTHFVEAESSSVLNDFAEMYFMSSTNLNRPIKVRILVNNRPLAMELDSGAAVSVLPEHIFKEKFSNCQLKQTLVRLKTYDGSVIIPEGEILVSMKHNNIVKDDCRLIIIKNGSIPLLGRDLMNVFNFNFCINETSSLHNLDLDPDLAMLLKEYDDLFRDELGLYKYEKINLDISPQVKPVFCKPRQIPFAFREAVDKELDELEKRGVISLVENVEWGTPLVPVVKHDGKIRLCADYKVTVNKYLQDVKHPMPRIEELFAALQGGVRYTKLDFICAYNQLELTDETKKLLCWSTHRGIYLLNRLPYGTKPACAIFQKKVEKVLQGAEGVINFMDDIVVTGRNREEHLKNLREVLERLYRAGFRLNLKKCKFFQPQIKYLGHIINNEGLHKDPEKIRAIVECPCPQDVSQIKSYLGMIQYYGKFVANLSTMLGPLYKLLKGDVSFRWDKECEQAFKESKAAISSEQSLAHFDPNTD